MLLLNHKYYIKVYLITTNYSWPAVSIISILVLKHCKFSINNSFASLFVYLRFIVPLENFPLIWIRRHSRWRGANLDLNLALMAIEQWGFYSVPHLMWHGATVYNGHLLPSVLPVALSLPFLRLGSAWLEFVHQISGCGANALIHYFTAADFLWWHSPKFKIVLH